MLSILLYADDIVLLSPSEDNMQRMLSLYIILWGLEDLEIYLAVN